MAPQKLNAAKPPATSSVSGFAAGLILVSAAALPANAAVTISSAQTQNMTCSAGVCAPTAAKAVLNVADLETLLSSGDVEVTTKGAGVQASNIRVRTPFGWSSASTLSLDARHAIEIDQPVSVTGSGGVSLVYKSGGYLLF